MLASNNTDWLGCAVLLLLSLHLVKAYYYCSEEFQKKVCWGSGGKHFLCDLEQVPSGGKFITYVPLTSKIRKIYLHEHNFWRNEIAGGKLKNKNAMEFPKATRMRELIWDKELAYGAQVHAARCNMEHDKCRATSKFEAPGQNLVYFMTSQQQSVTELIKDFVKVFVDEKNSVESPIEFIKDVDQGPNALHFAGVISERVSRLGCAMAYCHSDNERTKNKYHLTCQYDNLYATKFLYDVGEESATHCHKWKSTKSSKYEHLCANNGEIF